MRKLISIKPLLVLLAFAMVLAPLQATQVSAATNPTHQNVIPVEVVPRCSDAAAGLALWEVTNKNLFNIDGTWTNTYNNDTDVFTATPGTSALVTSYDAADANNRTVFDIQDNTPVTSSTNVNSGTQCAPGTFQPVAPPCIDGSIQQNLVVRFLANNVATVTPLNNQPLCADVTVFFSSYVMPANYNGQGFANNPTAYPQTLFNSASVVLPQGSTATQTLTIALPNPCVNTQVDVYYGPEITTVGPNGHGTQNILSQIYPSNGACPTTPVTPVTPVTPPAVGGKGAGGLAPVTVAAATAPAPAATPQLAQLPQELPKTGDSRSNLLALLIIIPLLVGAISYKGALEFQTRRMY